MALFRAPKSPETKLLLGKTTIPVFSAGRHHENHMLLLCKTNVLVPFRLAPPRAAGLELAPPGGAVRPGPRRPGKARAAVLELAPQVETQLLLGKPTHYCAFSRSEIIEHQAFAR